MTSSRKHSCAAFWTTAVLVVALLVTIASRKLSLTLIGIVERLPGPFRKIGPKLHAAYESLATMLHPKNLAVPTVLSIAAWSLECLALWIILRGFDQTTSVPVAAFFYATSTLVGALVPVPGGLGIANVLACGLFAAMAGSSPATCSAVGSAGIPEMKRATSCALGCNSTSSA